MVSWVCERALFQLLRAYNRDAMASRQNFITFDTLVNNQLDSDFYPIRETHRKLITVSVSARARDDALITKPG
jgi:hypothetical protein